MWQVSFTKKAESHAILSNKHVDDVHVECFCYKDNFMSACKLVFQGRSMWIMIHACCELFSLPKKMLINKKSTNIYLENTFIFNARFICTWESTVQAITMLKIIMWHVSVVKIELDGACKLRVKITS